MVKILNSVLYRCGPNLNLYYARVILKILLRDKLSKEIYCLLSELHHLSFRNLL